MVCALVSIHFDSFDLDIQQSTDLLNFCFLEKGPGLVSSRCVLCHFSRKVFLMLYSINWQNFMVWLPLLLEILEDMCIVIICFPISEVMKFEIKISLLMKLFPTWPKKSEQKFKYLQKERSFLSEMKSTFQHFQMSFRLSQTWKCAFKNLTIGRRRFWAICVKYDGSD